MKRKLSTKYLFLFQPKADHVKVTLYYEALCGGCHQWISDEMYPTYQKLGKYMDVEFVPYGNAHVRINNINMISFFSTNDVRLVIRFTIIHLISLATTIWR